MRQLKISTFDLLSMFVHLTSRTSFFFLFQFKGEITYELKDQAFCYTILDVPKDICSLATNITKWLSDVEICKVIT